MKPQGQKEALQRGGLNSALNSEMRWDVFIFLFWWPQLCENTFKIQPTYTQSSESCIFTYKKSEWNTKWAKGYKNRPFVDYDDSQPSICRYSVFEQTLKCKSLGTIFFFYKLYHQNHKIKDSQWQIKAWFVVSEKGILLHSSFMLPQASLNIPWTLHVQRGQILESLWVFGGSVLAR